MVFIYKNFFTNDIIEYICNLSIVIKSKKELEKYNLQNKYFSINTTPEMQNILFEKLGLNLKNVPMRWIKGDTKPHIDNGKSEFNNTHLVYITNGGGELLIENCSFPIEQNTCYVFSEGIEHETVNTYPIPRLLLGPMSETGFAVGSGIYVPGGTTIYIRQTVDLQYSVDGQINWINFGNNYPIAIGNSDTSNGFVIVEFITDITFNDSPNPGQNKYFYCSTDYIQFGLQSLNNDGSRPVITIDGVENYPGLIGNGNNFGNGFSHIYVFNLEIRSVNNSTLIPHAGWFGQQYFAKEASNCYIVNCFSNGNIPLAGGGIIGSNSGIGNGLNQNSSSLFIIGCSSQGNIGIFGGGIIGYNAGANGGYVKCEECWQEVGQIGISSGGIFGQSAASGESGIGGEAIAFKCYSKGSISGINAGGIFGQLAGTSGSVTAENCYSQGDIIDMDTGGIYGNSAASDGGTAYAINCYSTGTFLNDNNCIFNGGILGVSGRNSINCYAANGNWNSIDANNSLVGVPNPVVGTNWIFTMIDSPYEINDIGYTPYTIDNIVFEGIDNIPKLNKSYEQTIIPGDSSLSAIRSGYSYSKLQIYGGNPDSYSNIIIDSITGVISTTSNTSEGTYIIYIRNLGSYNITIFNLIISGSSGPTQMNNSFTNYNLLLINLTNTINLVDSGNNITYNNYFLVYDLLLLELLNTYLVNK